MNRLVLSIIAAAAAFAEASHPSDELFALGFNESVIPALSAAAPFTNDVSVLQNAITNTIRAHGRTALFDAITAGVEYLGRGRHERRVLVIVSDGGDNASAHTLDHVLAHARTLGERGEALQEKMMECMKDSARLIERARRGQRK